MFEPSNISEAILHLRCSTCTEYLSCPPIQVLPDGRSICGDCGASGGYQQPGYRNLSLETILTKVIFPCKYQSNGCEENLPFGESNNHKNTCEYQGFPCPGPNECSWRGPIQFLPEHFKETHHELVLTRAKFNVDVEKPKEAIVMVLCENLGFMLRYEYNPAVRELSYDMRHFKSVKEASCKFCLTNSSDNDYSVTVKGNPSQLYDLGFYNPTFSNVLSINNFLPVLNDAHELMVTLDLNVTKVELLRCPSCKNYLAIPIFEREGSLICATCCDDTSKPTTNLDLVKEITASVIPCRWIKCTALRNGDQIRKHEKKCKDRLYKCIFQICCEFFEREGIEAHMKMNHGHFKTFEGNCNYVVDSAKSWRENYFYTRFEDEIVIIGARYFKEVHYIFVKTTEFANEVRVSVVFKHSHCNKSKEFNVNDKINIGVKMLPKCFRTTRDLNVTIHVR